MQAAEPGAIACLVNLCAVFQYMMHGANQQCRHGSQHHRDWLPHFVSFSNDAAHCAAFNSVSWSCREAGGEAGATAHSDDSSSGSSTAPAAAAAAEAKAPVTKQEAGKQAKPGAEQQKQQQEQQAAVGGMASLMQDMFGLVYRWGRSHSGV